MGMGNVCALRMRTHVVAWLIERSQNIFRLVVGPRIINWIIVEFPHVDFKIHNFATGGQSSETVPAHVAPRFEKLNLSSSDIIIIDESVNDAGRPNRQLQESVKSMIRLCYSYAHGEFPTMIMIEQYPHHSPAAAVEHNLTFQDQVWETIQLSIALWASTIVWFTSASEKSIGPIMIQGCVSSRGIRSLLTVTIIFMFTLLGIFISSWLI